MEKVKSVCRAVFVLPFTAGRFKRWDRNEISEHDGSITGLILTTSLVAMVTEIMYTCSTYQDKHKTSPNIAKMIQITINCIGIVSYIAISIKKRLYPRTASDIDRNDGKTSIKLKFVWVFCLGCILFRVIKIILHVKCKLYIRENDSMGLALSYDFCAILFYLIQTGCLHYFSRDNQITKSLSTFYSLIMIVVANISSWTYHSTRKHDYSHTDMYSPVSNITDRCSQNGSISEIEVVFQNIRPFIEPMLLEYPLLCLLLIAEIWPNKPDDQEELNDSESTLCCEMTPLTGNRTKNSIRSETAGDSRKMYLTIALAFCISIPRIVTELIFIFGDSEENYLLVLIILKFLTQSVILMVLCGCFHALSNECLPLDKATTYTIRNLVLIVCSLVTTGYSTVQLMSYALFSTNYKTLMVFNDIVQIIVIYFQTVFILQITKYRIFDQVNKYISLRFLCLFVGFMNLANWCIDTFLVAQFIYKFRDINISGKSMDIFWFPFVIFYEFECFICFYSLYRMQ